MEYKLLIIEDDIDIAIMVKEYLSKEGYEIFICNTGEEGIDILKNKEIDLVLLDIMMPGIDGYETLSKIRSFSELPVIMITARGHQLDKVIGFKKGCDDYIVKPFDLVELNLRILAILRRSKVVETQKTSQTKYKDLIIDKEEYKVTKNDVEIKLTKKEFDILLLLMENQGKVYSTEEELEKYISVISQKGNLLKTMLDDFFDYAKLSSNDIETENTLINLNEMIKQLLDEEEINFKNKNLIINRTIENKKIFIHGDPILIARAFNNLIGNAIKYSKENTTINISVKVESKEGVDYGIVYIENTPRNMLTEENINNFFKRLYKVDKSRKEEGSGLGLVITKEIVKAHSGFIDVNLVNGEVVFKIGLIAEV